MCVNIRALQQRGAALRRESRSNSDGPTWTRLVTGLRSGLRLVIGLRPDATTSNYRYLSISISGTFTPPTIRYVKGGSDRICNVPGHHMIAQETATAMGKPCANRRNSNGKTMLYDNEKQQWETMLYDL